MKREQMIRTWKDEAYRRSLSDEELPKKSPEPADWEELTSTQLQGVSGGVRKNGDDAFVQVVVLAEKAAFYQAQFYAAEGWTDSPPSITPK